MARNAEKRMLLLRFLKEAVYSNKNILMDVIRVHDSGNFYRFMVKAEREGIIKKHTVNMLAGKVPLWGITQDGIAEVLDAGDLFSARFQPSKITESGLQQKLFVQKAVIGFQKQGFDKWISAERAKGMKAFEVKHRPDGVLLKPEMAVALECERTLKTKEHYHEAMKSYLVARKEDKWKYVFYVVPNEQKKRGLMRIFDHTKFLMFNGKPITIEPQHRNVFKFFTLDELIK
jgi:hypothetical protein